MADDWSATLAVLVAEVAAEGAGEPPAAWSSVVDDAHATLVVLQGVAALGRVCTDDPRSTDRDAVILGVEALRCPSTIDVELARDSISATLHGFGATSLGDLSLDRMLDRIEAMDEACVRKLFGSVQATLLAIEVEQALTNSVAQLPPGVSGGVITSRRADAVEGYVVDEDGWPIQRFEVKVDRDPSAARARFGDLVDTVIEHQDLLSGVGEAIQPMRREPDAASGALGEVGSALLPSVAVAMAGAELAWTAARKGDVKAALNRLRGRSTRAVVLSAAGHGISLATGVEEARLAIVLGARVGSAAVDRVDRELAGSIAHIRSCRELLDVPPSRSDV